MANSPMFDPGLPPVVEEVQATEVPVEEVTSTDEPTVVPTETVETPVATEPVESVVETPEPTQAEVKEVIREVEKIVEKYPEMDEYTTEMFQALLDGKEDVLLNYLSEKNRNYATMSDYDVVKANLKKSNPHYSDEDAALKIEMQYGDVAKIDLSKIDKDEDPDKYERAEDYNKTVDRNQKLLKLDAVEARANLESAKKEIKLPKIEKQEVQNPNQPSAESIEQGRKDWVEQVEREIPELKEFTFKVGDDKAGYEDVSYTVTDKERSEDLAFFKDASAGSILKRLGWVVDNGKQNVTKMAGDVRKLEKMQQLIDTAYTKGLTKGTKTTVAEIKNLDLSTNNQSSVAATVPDIGLAAFGHLNPK